MSTQFLALMLTAAFVLHGDRPPTGSDDPIRARLNKTLDEVRYAGEDLDDALSDLAEESGFNLVVDWPALEAIGIYDDTRIELSLKKVSVAAALDSVLLVADQHHLGAAFTIRDGLLTITSKAVLDRRLEVRAYEYPPSLRPGMMEKGNSPAGVGAVPWRPAPRIGSLRWKKEMRARGLPPYIGLAEAIQATVDPNSWERRGGRGSIRVLGDKLIVRQTQANHGSIERLLNDLSTSSRPAR